jgi:probable HAF family extracellular repeat protein
MATHRTFFAASVAGNGREYRRFASLVSGHASRFAMQACAVAILISAGASIPRAEAQQTGVTRYNVVAYATIEDPGESAVVRRINIHGEVAAGFKRPGIRQTFSALLVTPAQLTNIAADQPADYATANDVNDAGEVVGSFNSGAAMRPFRSLRGAGFQPLPVLPSDTGGAGFAINSRGEAVGYSSGAGGLRGVWWNRAGAITPLPALPAASTTRALGINDLGDIVGTAGDAVKRGVLWRGKGNIIDLGTLPGFTESEVRSINEQGAIVGFATRTVDTRNLSRAVLWGPAGQAIRDLGSLSPDGDSRAYDINARGEVVGSSSSADGDRAYIWTAATGMIDLNTLLTSSDLHLTEALGINDNGHILAVGHDVLSQEPGGHDDHEQPKRVVVLIPL